MILVDAGNSRIKLARADAAGVMTPIGAYSVRADALPLSLRSAERCLLLPGSQRSAACFTAWWQQPVMQLGRDVAVPDVGQYASFGLDRLCAGMAASTHGTGRCIVIDAGTATTLTAWDVTGPRALRLLGGLILPGAKACTAALAQAAPALPDPQMSAEDSDPLAMDTTQAIAAAIAIGYPAMVTACVERMRAKSQATTVLLTGGAHDRLHAPDRVVVPDLVLRGLFMIGGLAH